MDGCAIQCESRGNWLHTKQSQKWNFTTMLPAQKKCLRISSFVLPLTISRIERTTLRTSQNLARQRARDIFFHSRAAAIGPSFLPILSLLARLKVFVGCLKQSGMHDARPRRCHIHMCSDFEVLVEGISLQKLRLSSVHPMSLSAA